jgi:hypothetical protein
MLLGRETVSQPRENSEFHRLKKRTNKRRKVENFGKSLNGSSDQQGNFVKMDGSAMVVSQWSKECPWCHCLEGHFPFFGRQGITNGNQIVQLPTQVS